MVTRTQVETNRRKLQEIHDKITELAILHDTALFTYKINGEVKYIPASDIDALIGKYQTLKQELEALFGELL